MYAAVRLLGKEIILHRIHRAGVRKARAFAEKTRLKLNIGCGPHHKEGWVNIDLLKNANADLSLDMRERIPFPDGSAMLIYSEHFFEHLDYPEDAKRFLSECFRLLESNGIFRVGVPDTRWPLLNYANVGDGRYFEACKTEGWHPVWCKTPLDHINYHFRQGADHRYAYDFETMENALKETGFTDIRQCDFDPNLDSKSRAIGTLYVSALKPHRAISQSHSSN